MQEWSALTTRIQGSCPVCSGTGFVGTELCNCALKFRVFNRMIRGGFHENTLDLVSSPEYKLPMLESGLSDLTYFVNNPFEVMSKGLSLYLFSKENGRGKTTLAHYLVYVTLWTLSKTENYDPRRTYAFENMHDMCERERRGWDEETWKSTILVVDDIGTESRSIQWKREIALSMMHRVMHYRLDNCLPTIFTSNYTPSSLSVFYEGVLDSVLEIRPDGVIGGRVFRQIEVGGGEDYRLQASSQGGWGS